MKEKLKILLITGIITDEHDPKMNPMIRFMLESTGRFEVKITEEFTGATTATLAAYDAVFVNYDGKSNSKPFKGCDKMCTGNELDVILNYMTGQYKQLFGAKIKQIVLYGSYARGDFDEGSDIDIVAIVDCGREDIASYHRKIAEISSELGLEYGVMVSPSMIPYTEFIKYKDDLPYYRSIAQEGIVLSA